MQLGRGLPVRQSVETVEVFFDFGQSNDVGRNATQLLSNTDYYYQGVGAAYPALRTTQPLYVASPNFFYTYWKGSVKTADFSLDNGQWQKYQVGINSNADGAGDYFSGKQLAIATKLHNATGNDVYMVHYGAGGTSLIPGSATATPGNWNTLMRTTAGEYYMRRAIRDLKQLRPNARFRFHGFNWHQGETDGENGATEATYRANLLSLIKYLDNIAGEVLLLERPPYWNIAKLNYNSNASEDVINQALANVVVANNNRMMLHNITKWPKNTETTAAQRSPTTAGDGDNHSSLFALFGLGENTAANMLSLI